MLRLHKHNKETYERLTQLFVSNQRVAVVQPTGTGKSFIILKLISDNIDKKFIVLSPSVYIEKQIRVHAESNGIDLKNVAFITYIKLSQLSDSEINLLNCDYIVLDEFHRCGAIEWGRAVNTLLEGKADAKVLGTSATPIRYLDSGRNMAEEIFNGVYAVDMSLAEAINLGILPLPIYVTGLYSFSGEIEKLRLKAERTRNPKLKYVLLGKFKKAKSMITQLDCGIEKIFERHLPNNNGKYIIFCPNVEKLNSISKECDDWFVSKNIEKYKVYSDNTNSSKEFKAFCENKKSDSLKLLFCVDMLNEGIHIDDINGVIMLRSTSSANVFYQQLGRALACSFRNKKPLIFDIVNNFEVGDTAKTYTEIMEISRQNDSRDYDDIQFEIYDYVRDIREIIMEIQSTFANSWDYNFELVKTFYEENKHFPITTDTFEGVKIGRWCNIQRKFYKDNILKAERIEKLESIGFTWNLGDEIWNSTFNDVCLYLEKYGKFPDKKDVEENKRLYVWLNSQRGAYRKGVLTEYRMSQLESIGFEVKSISVAEKWGNYYQKLCDYRDKNGCLPTVESEEKDLYEWMKLQIIRKIQGKITAEQKEKLDKVGFIWNKRFEQWKIQFEMLRAFIDEFGRVPSAREKYKDFSVGQWYIRQLKGIKDGTICDEKLEMFNSLGITLTNATEIKITEKWNHCYKIFKNFIEKNRQFPKMTDVVDDVELYSWFMKQKEAYKSGKLQNWQIEKIRGLGTDVGDFLIQKRQLKPQWEENFNAYIKFITENHRKPKNNIASEAKLYRWEIKQRQRYRYATLSQLQVELLVNSVIINIH